LIINENYRGGGVAGSISRQENLISETSYLITLLKRFAGLNSNIVQTGEYNLPQDFSNTDFLGQQSIGEEVIVVGEFIK